MLFVCFFNKATLYGQTPSLDYSNYHTIFYDEFAYPDLVSGTDPLSVTTTSGTTFLHNWNNSGLGLTGGSTIYVDTQISLITGGTGALRLTEKILADSFNICSSSYLGNPPGYRDHSCTCSGQHISRVSGLVLSNPVFGYGILEARIKFPTSGTYTSPSSAFWTCCGKNEIDIFDVAYNSYLPERVIDWYYYYSTAYMYSSPYDITVNEGSTEVHNATGIPYPIDLSTDFHVYSIQWTPNDVSYYIDGFIIADIPYIQVRLYPESYGLEFDVQANDSDNDGKFMDIDWVKAWRQNCVPTTLNLSDVTDYYSQLFPNMYKYNTITSSSSTLIEALEKYATILEAEATIIQGNFIADQSTVDFGYPPSTIWPNFSTDSNASGLYGGHSLFSNGFFEILPSNCDTSDHGTHETGFRTAAPTPTNTRNSFGSKGSNNNTAIVTDDNVMSTSSNTINGDTFMGYSQIQVLPNPTKDNITITYPCHMAGQLEISIKDVSGRIRYTQSISCNEGNNVSYSIDLSSFVAGVYFIDLTCNSQHVVKKIVKI